MSTKKNPFKDKNLFCEKGNVPCGTKRGGLTFLCKFN